MTKTVLYARVSSSDQTIAHQKAHAEAAGFKIDLVISDEGVSGVKVPLQERREGRRLFDILRAGDVLVVRWLDRLGRNYSDVTGVVREFMARGVIIKTVIQSMTFDGATKDPMQKAVRDALLGFMAAMAEAQADATKEAQRAGIEHVRAKEDEPKLYLGRAPSFNREQLEVIRNLLAQDASPALISKRAGVSRQTVYRVKEDPAKAEAILAGWEALKSRKRRRAATALA